MLDLKDLEPINPLAILEYEEKTALMLREVNTTMYEINKKHDLIGDNAIEVMYNNHANHASFILNVFKLNDYYMLKNTLPWVVESYCNRGFQPEYFTHQLNTWIKSIKVHIHPHHSQKIIRVYAFIKCEVARIIDGSTELKSTVKKMDPQWEKAITECIALLLDGDFAKLSAFTQDNVNDPTTLRAFYLNVITPAMHEIGNRWQNGIVNTAQEHLATSMVMRIMAAVYLNHMDIQYSKGKAIVCSAPNEHHEVGARIIADIFEIEGWDVIYLGANTPIDDLIKYIEQEQPIFIAISITMSYNISVVSNLIKRIKTTNSIKHIKVIIGGLALNYSGKNSDLGADLVTNDINKAIESSRKWWEMND